MATAQRATAVAAEMSAEVALSHNLAGQKLGRKGRVTRERILAATAELLAGPVDEPISMTAVARKAELRMTSLYNYFTDLTELLLALLEPVMASADEAYLAMMREPWGDADLGERCYAFVAAYQGFWAKHTRLLHLRNGMSENADGRMMVNRLRATQPIIRLIVTQMGADPRAQRSPEFALATMLMIGIERSVTISTDTQLPSRIAMDIQHDKDHFVRPGARLLELAIRDVRAQSAPT